MEKIDVIEDLDGRFYLSLFIHLTPMYNNLWTKLKIISEADYFSSDVENCVFLCHEKLIIRFFVSMISRSFFIFSRGTDGLKALKIKSFINKIKLF